MTKATEVNTQAALSLNLDEAFWTLPIRNSYSKIIESKTGKTATYQQLNQAVEDYIKKLPEVKTLVAIVACNSIEFVIAYLACLRANHTILMLNESQLGGSGVNIAPINDLLELYQVQYLLIDGKFKKLRAFGPDLAPDLALLMSTSGTTGSAKCIKLTYQNLESNNLAIQTFLPISENDVVHANLPLSYSFGLSVLNTHLAVGSTTVLNLFSPFDRQYWQYLKDLPPTVFYGVPFCFETLIKLGLKRLPFDNVKLFAVAGGKLNIEYSVKLAKWLTVQGGHLYLMYGQTEATARIAYLTPEKLMAKPESIGCAIPKGQLKLIDENNKEIASCNTIGQLYYQGDNVFSGYANSASELANLEHIDWLATGDLAKFDIDGDFYLVGRLKRIIKLAGKRYSLDELESSASKLLSEDVLMTQHNDQLIVHRIKQSIDDTDKVTQVLSDALSIASHLISIAYHSSFPRLANGKIDYRGCDEKL